MALKRLIESIEVRGSRAYLYLLPFASPLEESAYAKVTANAARAAFPDDRQWVQIDGSLPDLRWPDGAHLDERSGFMIAKQIDHFLTGVAGGP
jgi:hypothetical protein